MRSWILRHPIASFLAMALIPGLAGCFIFVGDPNPITEEIQAFARQQTRAQAARAVDEMIVAMGSRRVSERPAEGQGVPAANEITINFMLPGGRTYVGATIEGRPRGARICIDIVGPMRNEEFEPSTKAAIARLRAALTDRFGERYVAAAPCSGEPYWPVANAP